MLGIIGGNGVAATNRLCQLIEETRTRKGAVRDAQHPEMIVWQATKAPSRSMFLEGKGPSWIEDYIEIGRKLKSIGCTELCMCCNTAHYAINLLKKEIDIRFVDLLDLVAQAVAETGAKKVGVLCSDGLRKTSLYDQYLVKKNPRIEVCYPAEMFQAKVTKAICGSKNKVRFEDERLNVENHPFNLMVDVCEHLQQSMGVDCIIAGCTDLNNIFQPEKLQNCVYIDSLVVLASYIESHF